MKKRMLLLLLFLMPVSGIGTTKDDTETTIKFVELGTASCSGTFGGCMIVSKPK